MGKQWLTLLFWALKSLQMVIAALKLKDAYSLEGNLWTNLDSILKSRHIILPTKVHLGKAMVFPVGQLFTTAGQTVETSASESVLPMNIQDWFPLGLIGLTSLVSKGLSEVFSSTQFNSISSLVLSLLYGSTLTSVHDYWKNNSFDYTDIC